VPGAPAPGAGHAAHRRGVRPRRCWRKEMEAVVRGFETGDVQRNDAAFEVLMRAAMLQLPDYLEARHRRPARHAAGAALAVETTCAPCAASRCSRRGALFAYKPGRPWHYGHGPAGAARQGGGHQEPRWQRCGRSFQSALLGWYKGDDCGQAPRGAGGFPPRNSSRRPPTPPVVRTMVDSWAASSRGLRGGPASQPDVSLKTAAGPGGTGR